MTTFQLLENEDPGAVIRVIGVGGGGGNAVQHMANSDLEGVDFIYANTDAQALNNSSVPRTLQMGTSVTRGLGAGAKPEMGRQAALEDRERIIEALQGADMLFIAAGMGGGTGTGAAPVVAQIAKELEILTVAVVTKPFGFEGGRRMKVAEQGLAELSKHVDSLITIPNEKLKSVLGGQITLNNAFAAANDVLLGAVRGIAELITRPGLINVDFADVQAVMTEMGMAMMGTGSARGDGRAVEAAELAIASPLLEDVDITGAKGVLVNVAASADMKLEEFEEVGKIVAKYAAKDANVVVGCSVDEDLQDEIHVTVVATGLNAESGRVREEKPEAPKAEVVNYQDLKKPAVMRQREMEKPLQQELAEPASEEDYLHIPTFLRRRQAD